jgi:hypothetical protein
MGKIFFQDIFQAYLAADGISVGLAVTVNDDPIVFLQDLQNSFKHRLILISYICQKIAPNSIV